ncbi:aquaporin [Kitasatospora sp. DSM 101779]|uniref:aquaporin n=1 Tax=Kitasatospora sp. DSM 101779 TaxID=2853165 RepID=UPI0021DAF8AD|nr:aquaporin [Kitasatospora sp. DSM 101779]MCU7823839.1 aquaporin [Kitasatospora sp. DSM 101779]
MRTSALFRRLAAEAVGTAVLAAVLIGSGLRAAQPGSGGSAAVGAVLAPALALGVLLAVLAPVSGAHLNPLVTAAVWWTGRRDGGPAGRELACYPVAQLAGAVAGAGVANAMFGRPLLEVSGRRLAEGPLWLAEAVATGVLLLVVCGLLHGGRGRWAPVAVAGWAVAACWGTSSGAFANPAVTAGRALSVGAAGIAPGSVPGFVLAQCAGAGAGLLLAALLFGPRTAGRDRPAGPGAADAAGGRPGRGGQGAARKDLAASNASSSASTSPGRLPEPSSSPPQRIDR